MENTSHLDPCQKCLRATIRVIQSICLRFIQVEIVGNIFLIDSRRQMDIYGVDDGTGCVKCVVWKRETTNLIDAGIVEEVGAKLAKAKLGALISFTGRIKTYKEKNELSVYGCHVLDSWKELVRKQRGRICYRYLSERKWEKVSG